MIDSGNMQSICSELTEEEKDKFAEWCRSEEATKLFEEGRRKVKQESEAFRKRTSISDEILRRPFNV